MNVVPGFLHTASVHVPSFDALLDEQLPAARAVHVVDPELLERARAMGPAAVADQVRARLEELRELGAGLVCCTCSTIGGIAEQAHPGVLVFRVDRPMAAMAVRMGSRIGVVAAVESTLEPTRHLVKEEAQKAGMRPRIRCEVSVGAWDRFESGDMAGYLHRVADTARVLGEHVDVVVLAQASMAGAATLLTDLPVPVLSSPRLAIRHLANHP